MITITKKIVTPMLRLVLEWDPLVGATTYVVKLREASGSEVVSETTESTTHRLEQRLKNATWYHVQVLAMSGDELVDQSAVINVYTTAQVGTAVVLRQACYDSVENAGITMVSDGCHRPRAWGRTSAPSTPLPCVEIGMPALASSEPYSDTVKLHTWQVPITLIVSQDCGDPDRDADAWLMFELIQGAVDSDGLLLNRWGVIEEQWSWQASLSSRGKRSKTTVIEATLSVLVRKLTGVILLPQPESVPAEPTPPTDL